MSKHVLKPLTIRHGPHNSTCHTSFWKKITNYTKQKKNRNMQIVYS